MTHNIGLIGDTGMVGQEIEKILRCHDRIEISYRKNSKREEGDLENTDLVILATNASESLEFAPKIFDLGKKVIDMSGAFRLSREQFEKWYKMEHTVPELIGEVVYGLPAYFADEIAQARLVANPGCYPTAILFALKPLEDLLQGRISLWAISGNSGARREVEEPDEITYDYGRRHPHVPEIENYSGFRVDFMPVVLRSVFRGINANIRGELVDRLKSMSEEEAVEEIISQVQNSYQAEDLVCVEKFDAEKGTKLVKGSHKVLIKVGVDEGFVYISSMIDNLLKGAASQAVENMNLMLGLPRLYGLHNYC